MDPLIPATVGISALAVLFAVLTAKSWRRDRRAARDAVNRRLG